MISYEYLFKLNKNIKRTKSNLVLYDQTQNETVNRTVEISLVQSCVIFYTIFGIEPLTTFYIFSH